MKDQIFTGCFYRPFSAIALSLLAVATVPAVLAAESGTMDGKVEMPAGSKNMALKPEDVKFIGDAASGGMLEVEASKLAMQRSTDPEVKQFAQMMVKEHTENAAMLKQVVMKKGAMMPATLMPAHQKMLNSLREEKAGKEFDEAYSELMVASHKETVSKFKDAKDKVTDTDLRDYASKSLPVLEHHTQMAEKLEDAKG